MTENDQVAIEKMARELEELKAWVAAHDEFDRHRQLASLIRRTVPDPQRRDILSISGVVELVGEKYPDDPRLVNPTYLTPKCPICKKDIVERSLGFRVRTSFHVFGGSRREEYVEYHASCVNAQMFDSSDERYFEG